MNLKKEKEMRFRAQAETRVLQEQVYIHIGPDKLRNWDSDPRWFIDLSIRM